MFMYCLHRFQTCFCSINPLVLIRRASLQLSNTLLACHKSASILEVRTVKGGSLKVVYSLFDFTGSPSSLNGLLATLRGLCKHFSPLFVQVVLTNFLQKYSRFFVFSQILEVR